jgi:hypothetical protein
MSDAVARALLDALADGRPEEFDALMRTASPADQVVAARELARVARERRDRPSLLDCDYRTLVAVYGYAVQSAAVIGRLLDEVRAQLVAPGVTVGAIFKTLPPDRLRELRRELTEAGWELP